MSEIAAIVYFIQATELMMNLHKLYKEWFILKSYSRSGGIVPYLKIERIELEIRSKQEELEEVKRRLYKESPDLYFQMFLVE